MGLGCGGLGLLEAVRRIGEVSAAILFVGVEKQRIEPPVDIVMVCDVVARALGRIELTYMPDQVAYPPLRRCPARQHLGLIEQDREQVGDAAIFNDERAIHVGFAEREFRIEENSVLSLSGREPHRDRIAGAIAAGEFCPACGRACQRTAANELPQKTTQQTVHQTTRPNDPARCRF